MNGNERFLVTFGAVAQLVERLLCKQDVRSSSLLCSTILGLVAQLVRARA